MTLKKQKNVTKGKKNDKGKPSLTLIPGEAILAMGIALTYGADKYGRYNFRKGVQHSRLLDAAMRHLNAILRGEEIDEESGNHHLWHAMASLAMLEWMRVNRPDLNDMYVYTKRGKKK